MKYLPTAGAKSLREKEFQTVSIPEYREDMGDHPAAHHLLMHRQSGITSIVLNPTTILQIKK